MEHFVWVLTERTDVERSLEVVPPNSKTVGVWAFDSFEKARAAMRRLIALHATSDNELFDGNGYFHPLEDYFNENLEDDGNEYRSVPHLHERFVAFQRCVTWFRETLPHFLTDAAYFPQRQDIQEDFWTNRMAEWSVSRQRNGSIVCRFADVECNSLPIFQTNCMVMDDPECGYYFKVGATDAFDDEYYEVILDLLCCPINETPEDEYANLQG